MKMIDNETCNERHSDMCSIARSLEKIGDSWSLLILRDLGQGLSKYDELKESLEISPATLSKRLSILVEEKLVVKVIYQENPLRAKYVLTPIGQEFLPVLAMIMVWGNKYASPNGIDTQLVDETTHRKINPIVVDGNTGKQIEFKKLSFSGGPGNSPGKTKFLIEHGAPLMPVE
jgi:DNA-binding HxlR family transcriptional regulator